MRVGVVFIPVLWFGLDFKCAASKEVAAFQARQQYLTTLATERCAALGEALLWCFEQQFGSAFTPELRAAWVTLYDEVQNKMISAAKRR
jgi:hemoglobin-like flavoprotein